MSPDGEYIDWRSFLLAASKPWPEPNQADLLNTLERFKEMDQQNVGMVTREQYERVSRTPLECFMVMLGSVSWCFGLLISRIIFFSVMSIVDYLLDIKIFIGTTFHVLKCQNDMDL